MKSILLAVVLLALPSLAQAQGHPCDLPAQTSFTVPAGSHTLSVCWPERDTADVPVVAVQWGVTINGVRSVVAMTKATPTPNGAGLYQYTGTITTPKGSLSIGADVCIDDGTGSLVCAGLASPLGVKSQGPGPKPPVKGSVN